MLIHDSRLKLTAGGYANEKSRNDLTEDESDEFFFFQAEDSIRDRTVTGVQTCALPIYSYRAFVKASVKGFTVEAAHSSRTKVLPAAPYQTLFDDPNNSTLDQRSFLDVRYE